LGYSLLTSRFSLFCDPGCSESEVERINALSD
jgi:hypothetical protein